VVFTLASLGLADLPLFATFLGKGWIGASAAAHGMPWITAVLIICSVLVGGAVLRVAGGVFYGLGDPPIEDRQIAAEAPGECAASTQRSSAACPGWNKPGRPACDLCSLLAGRRAWRQVSNQVSHAAHH
jgi:formate hydrogenlyase subunit 3/multisubunit Na+/H+ antiporter MnhD subunit